MEHTTLLSSRVSSVCFIDMSRIVDSLTVPDVMVDSRLHYGTKVLHLSLVGVMPSDLLKLEQRNLNEI